MRVRGGRALRSDPVAPLFPHPTCSDTALARSMRDRILNEMLGSVMDGTGGGWKALVLDPVTTRCVFLFPVGVACMHVHTRARTHAACSA